MPIPKPSGGEKQSEFISRFMADKAMQEEFPEQKQRLAVAYKQWRDGGRMSLGSGEKIRVSSLRPGDRVLRSRGWSDGYSEHEIERIIKGSDGVRLHCKDGACLSFAWGDQVELLPERVQMGLGAEPEITRADLGRVGYQVKKVKGGVKRDEPRDHFAVFLNGNRLWGSYSRRDEAWKAAQSHYEKAKRSR